MNRPAEYAKAITAALVAFLAAYNTATAIPSPAGEGITRGEWIALTVATIAAGTAVWLVPNAAPKKESDDDDR